MAIKINYAKKQTLLFFIGMLVILMCSACDRTGSAEDPCYGVTCSGFGDCVNNNGEPLCLCNSGFHQSGTECVEDLCRPVDCLHGHCENPARTSNCVCDDGYDGVACDRCSFGYHLHNLKCVLNGACDEEPCVHGTCVDNGDGYECVCSDSIYTGKNCDQCSQGYHYSDGRCYPETPCNPNPCGHGYCREVKGKALCACENGYTGEFCTDCTLGYVKKDLSCVKGDKPLPESCDPNPCSDIYPDGNRNECKEESGGIVCQCDDGYHLDDDKCVQDESCDPNPCLKDNQSINKTRCVIEDGKAVCHCDLGYHPNGDTCEQDTVCDPDITCSGNGSCTGNGMACKCDTGYAGKNCNECDTNFEKDKDGDCVPEANACNPNPCSVPNKTKCVLTPGDDFECNCDEGHSQQYGVCVADCDVDTKLCNDAHASFDWIVSANGFGASVFNLDEKSLPWENNSDGDPNNDNKEEWRYMLTVHPYKTWGNTEPDNVSGGEPINSRDILYDTYFGLMVDGTGTWLNTIDRSYTGYYYQEGIPHWVQFVGDIRTETIAYAPWQLKRPALVSLVKVTNTSDTAKIVSVYSIQNYHIGSTNSHNHIFPGTDGESITRDSNNGAMLEQGPGGVIMHYPLGSVFHYAAAQGGDPADPWKRLTFGQDLGDENNIASGNNRVSGFQGENVTLQKGQSAWFGVVSAFEAINEAANITSMKSELESAYAKKTADVVLQEAVQEWENWRKPMPQNLSPSEKWVYRTSETVLRMGQVWEAGKSRGQILASLPPGIWAISWIRDMSYSIAGLIRSGHYKEAKAALSFVLNADVGDYQKFYFNGSERTGVGEDYQISVCRYFGNGREESDWDHNGPNVEFDGFGLFLWVLGEYVQASRDTQFVDDNWDTISIKVADVLQNLIDQNGLVRADSSIWEEHWNGLEEQFVYTSLAAAKGLCEASILADQKGVSTNWKDSSKAILQAIKDNLVDSTSFIAQSKQQLDRGTYYTDAAAVEAFNWMLFDPAGTVADRTFNVFENELTVPHGNGYFRNDDANHSGDSYDTAEWVFIDLRMALALRLSGKASNIVKADKLVDWITAQGIKNMGLIAELHERTSADYDGAVPMVGFGAGSYIMNLWQREVPVNPAPKCDMKWSD